MAYPISNEALRLFKEAYRQVVDIRFNGLNDTLTLSEEDIVAGGLSINRYSVSGSKIEIGSAVAAELSLVLDNADGKFNEVMFEGAELYVRIGTKKWDARRWENAQFHYIPFGYFTIDEAPRKLEKITLTALDRMVVFDKPVDNTKIVFPLSVADLLDRVCTICQVSLGIDATELTNADYIVNKAPTDDDLTYRQYIAWIAEITGTCAFIDWNGKLVLKWYESTETEITLKDRYSSDLQENAITISGVQVVFGEESHLVGNDSYAFNIESNSLIQHDPLVVAEGLFAKLYGFSYTPFTATIKPMPHLYPLDGISFVDKLGVAHPTIVTDCTFTLNNSMTIEGKGETAAKNGYATMNPLTARERAILSKVKNEFDSTISSRAQALLELNETICNSIGLRRSIVHTDGEGDIYYYHNNETLEDSSIIYTFKSGGFAWTHDWNDGEPVWEYGFTQDGNAVYNALSTYKIQTQHLDAGCVTAEKITLEAVRDKWNSVSEYLKLSSTGLKLYSASSNDGTNLLMDLGRYGTTYYYKGNCVGSIGTNRMKDDDNYRGLVFDLEANTSYMCWAVKDSSTDTSYTIKLAYFNNDDIRGEGLHLGCTLYGNSNTVDGIILKNVVLSNNVTAGIYATYTGDLKVISKITDNGDGTFSATTTTHKVVNGLLVS